MVCAPSESLSTADRFAHALHTYLCSKYYDDCTLEGYDSGKSDPCLSCPVFERVGLTSKE